MRKWTGAALLIAVLAAACGCAAKTSAPEPGTDRSVLQTSMAPNAAVQQEEEIEDEAPELPGFSLGIGDAVRDYARVSGAWERDGEAEGEEQAARIEITWLGTFEAYDADGHILSGGVVEYEEQEDGTFAFGLYDGKHELWNRFADPGEETAETLVMELDGSLYVRADEEEEEAEDPSGWTEAESLADMPAASAIGFVLPPEEAVPSGFQQADLACTEDAVQVRYAGTNGMLTVRAGLHTNPEELAADEYEDYPDQWEEAYGETALCMLGSAGLANDVLFEADGVSWAILCCPGLVGEGLSREEVHALIRGLEALPEPEKQADYVLEYGESGRWTEEETKEAAAVVMEEFEQMEGCVMQRLSLNEEKSEASLSYIRELRPAVDFSECIVFDSLFRSPKDAGALSGWEPDTEYTWDWYLGRIEGGRWQVVTYGY